MKITLIFLLMLSTLNSFAETPNSQGSSSKSQVTIEDTSTTAEAVATPVAVEEETSTTPASEEMPSEESADTSSDDGDW